MKFLGLSAAALLSLGTSAWAVGLDRSNQDITAIFEDGNHLGLSFGYVMPQVSGTDLFVPGVEYDGVAESFAQLGASLKLQINPQLSAALIFDQPFGVDLLYPGDPAASMFGGTAGQLDSLALTAMGRYEFSPNFSIHAGVRAERLSGDITLSGLAFAGLTGYNVALEESDGFGYVVGAAYERPDIALRLAVTYHSAITHEFNSIESVNGFVVNPGSTTTVQTPDAINIDFQTGIAPDTLLFGQIRHARYSQTIVSPDFFAANTGGDSLTDIDDGTSYSIGVGRRFSDQFSASITVGYEASGDPLVSPLSPTNGTISVGVGGEYQLTDAFSIGAGVRYSMLGDADPESGGVARADFNDNSVIALGVQVGYSF